MTDTLSTLRPSIAAILVFTAALGIGYPLCVGGVAQIALPDEARGSLIRDGAGRIAGSALVGQPFDDPAYFWSRPTAIAAYNALTSGGTNAGPTGFVDQSGTLGPNPALTGAVRDRLRALRAADPDNAAPVPIDLVTASASGLDPDITPAAALYQVGRVARSRGVTPERVRALVGAYIKERTLGVIGERRVNVLSLNRALNAAFGAPST